jgi:hypothetical protein
MDIVGVITGAILGWMITHFYWVKSNRQQQKDMDDLRQNNTILRQQAEAHLSILDKVKQTAAVIRRHGEINLAIQEEDGKLDANRDENGVIIGKNATAHANIQAISALQATATVTPAENTNTNNN